MNVKTKNNKNFVISEERLDLCLSAGNLAWWEMDLKTGKVVFNENKVKMLGFSTKEFENVDYNAFMNLVHPKDYDRVMKAMQDHLDGKKKLYEVEYRIKTKNGDYKWYHDRGSIVKKDDTKKPLFVKGVVFDITEERKAKEELKSTLNGLEKIINERTKELTESNRRLKSEIDQRKKVEEYIQNTQEFFKNVMDSVSELIISFDMNKRVSFWNETAEKITGYKNIEVINRGITKLEVFENPKLISMLISDVCEFKNKKNINMVLITKKNEKKIIRVSGTAIKGKDNTCIGAVFYGRDVTSDFELHKEFIEGSSYLLTHRNDKLCLDIFLKITLMGFKGLIITRSSPSIIKSKIPISNDILVNILSQESFEEFDSISSLDSLTKKIQKFSQENKKSIILLDGVHYLLTKFSFEQFAEYLYRIKDINAKNKSILLLRVDPQILNTHHMAVLENELQLSPTFKIDDIILEDEIFNILNYIFEQNQANALVSYKKVISKFKIAYLTAASRLKDLESKGLIITKRKGKLRTIFITERGENLIYNKKITS